MQPESTPDPELAEFRAAKDAYMRGPDSPLGPQQRAGFQGLDYYPPNASLRLELPLDGDVSDEPVTMETSTGGAQEYRRAGKIRFEVDGQPAELTIFASHDQLFLPLRDATNRTDTYPAGRYLEPEPLGDGKVLVDFNYLYNPYCAYNDQWSCPIPPVENWISVPIAAGEKRFHP
ncbi:MAG TPA: DUF1684 domain-containing protein [Chloroflexota bacterium]|nr:DUF1684 domain-containing protein [Chloroflexota bacterium]